MVKVKYRDKEVKEILDREDTVMCIIYSVSITANINSNSGMQITKKEF